ncbi:MAG: hypothetical protein ABS873_00930, partial [Alkalibacterium sp.]
GDYTMQSERLLTLSGQEVLNPLAQVNRSLVKLKQLFIQLQFETELTGAAVFVNPSFHLYRADAADAFVFPGQLPNYLRNISQKASHLSKEHRWLAEKLLDLDKRHTPYEKELPTYDFQTMKKQLNCPVCGSQNVKLTQRSSCCRDSQHLSSLDSLCLSTIADLRSLFPDKKLTTALVYEWCGGRIGNKRVRQVLKRHFKQKGRTTPTYYE